MLAALTLRPAARIRQQALQGKNAVIKRNVRARWLPLGDVQVPTKPGRYPVTLTKPMQMTLAEKPGVGVVVDSLVEGGRAEKAGIRVGDIIEECSVVILKGDEGHLVVDDFATDKEHKHITYDHFTKGMLKCQGQSFETVIRAIGSNSTRWGFKDVDLVIRRPEPEA